MTTRRGLPSGLAAGTVVLFLGSGAENILWPFQMGMMGALAFGLAAWLALDGRTRRGDAVASFLLFCSLASAGMGIPLTAGVVVRLLWTRADRRRLWLVVPPGVLYGAWWLGYGQSQGTLRNLRLLGSYGRDMLAGDLAALGGRPLAWGLVALGIAATLAATTLLRRRGATGGSAGALTVLGVNVVLTTYARGDLHEPASGRYVYLGAVGVLVAWAELWPRTAAVDDGAPPRAGVRRRGRLEVAIALVLTAVAVKGNHYPFLKTTDGFRHTSDSVRAGLRAIEWAPSVPTVYRADPALAPPVFAGIYLRAVREFGSPAMSGDELAAAGEDARLNADRVSLEIQGTALAPPPAGAPAGCTAPSAARAVDLGARPAVVVRAAAAPVEVRLWRFASEAPTDPTTTVGAGATATVRAPQDAGPATWQLLLSSRQPFVVCDA